MTHFLARIRMRGHAISSEVQRFWLNRVWGMDIGRGVKLSRSTKLDKLNPRGIHIGDWTTVAFDVAVLAHDMHRGRRLDTFIGSYCFIGAKSVIMPGVRIGDHSVVGAGSVVMTDVPPHCLVAGNPAKIVRSGIVTGRWGIGNQSFLEREAERGRVAARPASPAPTASVDLPRLAVSDLLQLLRAERPELGEADLERSLVDLGLDSFALINLRIAIETRTGKPIADSAWQILKRPADLLAADGETAMGMAPQPSSGAVPVDPPVGPPVGPPVDPQEDLPLGSAATSVAASGDEAVPRSRTMPAGPRASPAGEWRDYRINLPQMAMRGLGEPWLMKELGDVHWSAMLRELGTNAASLADSNGDRLYGTFTRIRWRSDVPLTDYRESEAFELETRLERYGAGMFFSRVEGRGAAGSLFADIMTTFAKYGEAGANTSLLKGQPVVPPGCAIPTVASLPEFAAEYRALRAGEFGAAIFECDYEQQPPHDINGVGLLYFAAYPTIFELCVLRHAGRRFATGFSLVERDICYFANADPDETLRFRLHAYEETEDGLSYRATLSRTSDGKVMALTTASKVKIDLPPPGRPLPPRN